MELAISNDFAGEYPTIEGVEDCIRRIAEAGYTHAHWCLEWDGDYLYSHSEMVQAREMMDKYGLKTKALHASKGSGEAGRAHMDRHARKDYTSTIEYNRRAGVELIKNRVEFAHVLGTTEIVLHLCLPYEEFIEHPESREVFYGQVYKSLDELQPYCLERNVRICFEDLYGPSLEMQIDQYERLFTRYPAEYVGLCLDTGHTNLIWGKDAVEKFVDRYKDRLYAIHAHDNFGWECRENRGDAHKLPGEGNIDWESLMKALRKSAYRGPWVLEVNKPAGEDTDAYLKRAYEAGQKYMGQENRG